ncbi:hypothetical protein VNI00_011543 [Paramarasmius palmivorus]|uniref:Uncharacterized protein n=1 Tax=Paramarasmius palmivorus TaxID=297713 RepID=A0AAW0CBE7_9AGAR
MSDTTPSYFLDPAGLSSTLQSAGWKKAIERDEMYQFWKQTWTRRHQNQSRPPHLAHTTFPIFRTFKPNIRFALEREEYKKMYDWLHDAELANSEAERSVVTVTGHPGIGKTVFGIYVLYRRCVDAKPTLYFDPRTQSLLLFHQDGVDHFPCQLPHSMDLLRPFTPDTWLVVDGSRRTIVPDSLVGPAVDSPRIIFTASPSHRAEWISWDQLDLNVTTVYMQGWNDSELEAGSILHHKSWEEIASRVEIVGKVPRSLFRNKHKHEQDHEEIERAVSELSVEHLKHIFKADSLQESSGGPNSPHLIQYLDRSGEDFRAKSKRVLLSNYVTTLIRCRMLELDLATREQILNVFSGPGQAKQLVGIVYEFYVLDQLAHPNFLLEITLYRMVHMSRSSRNRKKSAGARRTMRSSTTTAPSQTEPQWCTAYGRPSVNRSLQDDRNKSLDAPIKHRLKGMPIITYGAEDAVMEVESKHLYVPTGRNDMGICAFYVEEGVLWLLQTTAGAEHKFHDGILTLRTRFLNLPTDWRLVFVQPYTTCMVVPYNKHLSGIEIFHACIKPTILGSKIPKEEAQAQVEEEVVDAEDDEEEPAQGALKRTKK